MDNLKISIIGAGSGAFSLGMIRDICLTPNLAGSTISFMDIDERRLESVFNLCKRYSEELGVNLKLEKTLDRKESLQGADFVVNTALTASHNRLQEGWEIARRHGFRLGGSYHVMYDEAFWINYYQLKFFESITEDILSICPDSWHLMVANPVITGVTHLYRKYPNIKMVGLCHGYTGVYEVAEVLGLDKSKVTFEIPGVNHHVWLTKFYYKGSDAFPLLDAWIENESEDYWASGKSGALSRKRIDLYKKYKALPIGDTASWSGASWPWWYHHNGEEESGWNEIPQIGWDMYFNDVNESAKKIQKVANDMSISVTKEFPAETADEWMIPLIESIACDIPRTFVVNIPNSGQLVPGIPEDFEVEVQALVSKRGVQGIRTQGLPKEIVAHILRDRVSPIEMELEAFNRGSRQLLSELILMDKWATSTDQANDFIDDIFALPYHKELRKHYK